ncbi:MAG: class I SAM-dependent methyltransferase [Acidimicrobiales bacterium]
MLGDDLPIRVEAYDGTAMGPENATTLVKIVSPDAVHRIVTARGQELGFSRAIIAGEIEIEGDVFGLFDVTERVQQPRLDTGLVRSAMAALGVTGVRDVGRLRPLPPPPEEIRLSGRLHSRSRDAEAISSHYDVSNAFYDLVLGTSMTYSCALFEFDDDTLDTAQSNKYDLICRKLALEPGMRHLDIGCGWGGMVLHAAKHYGVHSVGVTISTEQAERARKRVANAGLADQIEIRIQDYRDIADGPFDAISSIGMAEHVGGEGELRSYFDQIARLLAPKGRVLNHAISRAATFEGSGRNGFIQRYVFPDGELHEIGRSISTMQEASFEVLHMENLRLHYARTLRAWVGNLEDNWDEAVAEVGRGRAMVWRLYMAGSAVAFERGEIQINQVLAVHEGRGPGDLSLRLDW